MGPGQQVPSVLRVLVYPPMLSPHASPRQNTKSSAMESSSWIPCPVLVLNKWLKSSEEEVIPFTWKMYLPFEKVQLIWFASLCIWSPFASVLKLIYFTVLTPVTRFWAWWIKPWDSPSIFKEACQELWPGHHLRGPGFGTLTWPISVQSNHNHLKRCF